MESLILTWLTAILFVMLPFWGTNVPTERRPVFVYYVVATVALFNLYAQGYLFNNRTPMGTGPAALGAAADATQNLEAFLRNMALAPGALQGLAPAGWYRVITSSLLHYGWLHLIFNIWFFVLFGHVLERVLGAKKLAAMVAAGLVIPAALEGWFPVIAGDSVGFTGGFSGVVYAVMGAYLVCLPRSRFYGAFNYDLRYWACILFVMLPVTMVTRFAGLALTEMVIVLGMVGLFLLIQPEHVRVSAPVIAVIFSKLAQDVALIEPVAGEVISNTVWRIGGGFVIGVAGGFLFHGNRGWKRTWDDETKFRATAKRSTGRTSIAQLEAEGHKTAEAARIYLGQRVFVGDAVRAARFYRDVIIPKFPDMALPSQEQMALARMLHFKGSDAEALHAYEIILRTDPLPEEHWIAWLKAAEYVAKLAPHRSADARRYLDRFEAGGNILMRDRIEAERLRAELPVVESPAFDDDEMSGEVGAPRKRDEAPEKLTPDSLTDTENEDNGGSAINAHKEKTSHATVLDFPKVTPRTFRYVAGGETVSLGLTKSRRKEKVVFSFGDFVESYWKPMKCLTENKTMPSLLDRPVKNPRVASDDDNKPSMYGTLPGVRAGRTGGGRLSRLELVRKDIGRHAPKPAEHAGRYGGLGERSDDAQRQPKLRLRGETEAPQRVESRRTKGRREEIRIEGVLWERALAPGEQMPEDKSGYGEEAQE